MKKLTDKIIFDFLNCLFTDDMDGIWIDTDGESFSFCSEYLGSEELSGTAMGINYKVAMGATKICFILEDYDAVIKMPVTGTYVIYYDEETDEDHYEIFEDNDINDIDTEIDKYRTASPAMKEFLLPNFFVGVIRDIPVYRQEAVKDTFYSFMIDDTNNSKFENDSLKLAYEYREEGIGTALPVGFVSSIIETQPLFKNILSEVISISDIHNENIGYTYAGKAVCFDYAM
jgi:hypothetical protein